MIEEFELHCQNLQLANAKKRSDANTFLTNIRNSQKPYELCFAVLSNEKTSGVAHFQAAMIIRAALIREWASMTSEELVNLRVLLLTNAVRSDSNMPGFVLRQLMDTVAVLAKCMWLDHPELQDDVFNIISQLLGPGTELHQQQRGIDLASCLVSQFSTAEAGQMNLSFEFHDACKKLFSQRLQDLFITTMKHLNKIVEDFTSQSFSNDSKKSALALAISCLELMESILSWPFGHSTDKSKLITLVPTDIDDAKTIDLPLEWKETFLIHMPSFVEFLFNVHESMRNEPELTHAVRNVFERFCCIGGVCFLDVAVRQTVLQALVPTVTRLLSNTEDVVLLLDACRIAQSLIHSHGLEDLLCIEAEQVVALLKQLTTICVNFLQAKAQAHSDDEDTQKQMIEMTLSALHECIDECLFVPSAFAIDGRADVATVAGPPMSHINQIQSSKIPEELANVLRSMSLEIFVAFVSARIGSASDLLTSGADDEEEGEPEDVDAFRDQLICVGSLTRVALSGSVDAIRAVLNLSQQLIESAKVVATGEENIIASETAHWLLLITVHILNDLNAPTVIPASLNFVSINCQNAEEDPVLVLGQALLAFVNQIHSFVKEKGAAMSPLLAKSEMWALKSWLRAYGFPAVGRGLSPKLTERFMGSSGDEIVEFVIVHTGTVLHAWGHDHSVFDSAVELLQTLSHVRDARMRVLNSQAFQNLATCVDEQLIIPLGASIAPKSWRKLASALLRLGSKIDDQSSYISLVSNGVIQRFKDLCFSAEFAAHYQEPHVKHLLSISLEWFRGMFTGATTDNYESLYQLFVLSSDDNNPSLLDSIVALIKLFSEHHDIITLSLKCLRHLCHALVPRLPSEHLTIVAEACITVVDSYCQSAVGRRTAFVGEQLDEQRGDLSAFIVLTHSFVHRATECQAAAQLVMKSVAMLLHLICGKEEMHLLQMEKVARKFFLFLETLLDAHSAALLRELDGESQQLLLRALQHGFRHTNELVVICAFESVQALRDSDQLDVNAEAQLIAAVLVALVVGAVRSAATVATASRALLTRRERLGAVLEQAVPLIVSQLQDNDADVRQRLNHTFNELFSDTDVKQTSFGMHAPPTSTRSPAQQFQIRLRLFVAYVRAIVRTA